MEKFIELFYFLVYDPETANYYWHNTGVECCLKWGFGTLIVCSFLFTLFFYFYWSNIKIQEHASLSHWIKVGVWGMLITFIVSEIIVGNRSQLVGLNAYIGQDGLDILVFSLYSSIIGFAIMYLLFSTDLLKKCKEYSLALLF